MTTTTRPRDSQLSKLYGAERAAFPEYFNRKTAWPGFHSTTECEVWIGRILRNPKAAVAARKVAYDFAEHGDDRTPYDFYRWPLRVRVDNSQGAGGARAIGSSLIEVSGYYRNPVILLHELAHLVAPESERHGPVFAAHYLALVRVTLGVRAHDRLRDAFKKNRVKYKPKRTLSPERRAVLVSRLAAARAKSPIFKTDEQYTEHMAGKNDGADNIDDPRVLRFVIAQQRIKDAALAIANTDGSYT